MVSKINFVNSIRALEILLKGAAILCFSPLVYIFEIREFGICTIADFPGCAFFLAPFSGQ